MELPFKPRIIDPDAKHTHCERTPHIQTQFRITNLKCGRNNNNYHLTLQRVLQSPLISNFVNFFTNSIYILKERTE